jgi:hypothetical protein
MQVLIRAYLHCRFVAFPVASRRAERGVGVSAGVTKPIQKQLATLATFDVVSGGGGGSERLKPETGNKPPSQVLAGQCCNQLPVTTVFIQQT